MVGLLLDWITERLQDGSPQEVAHRPWMDNLAELLEKHTTAPEADIIMMGLHQRAAGSFDSLWRVLYKAPMSIPRGRCAMFPYFSMLGSVARNDGPKRPSTSPSSQHNAHLHPFHHISNLPLNVPAMHGKNNKHCLKEYNA